MLYLTIDRNYSGGYILRLDDIKGIYYGYSLNNAIKQFRLDNNLERKHINIIKIY